MKTSNLRNMPREELSACLSTLAEQTYKDRFASKEQLASVFAYTTDLSGINEENIHEKINDLIKRNSVLQEKAEFAEIKQNCLLLRPQLERKWRLDNTVSRDKGTMLVLDSDATALDIAEANSFLNLVLGHNNWWQLSEMNVANIAKETKPINAFKALGKYDTQNSDGTLISGNPAVDTVPIIKIGDVYRVVTITRQSGEKALNGGMNEGMATNKLTTAIAEFLEEMISGSLFNKEFNNNDIANNKFSSIDDKRDFISNCLGAEVNQHEKKLIVDILSKDGDFSNKFVELMSRKSEFKMTDFDFDHLVVSLKISLYKNLCSEQYKRLTNDLLETIKSSKIKFGEIKMQSDARGCPKSSVTTSPFVFVLDEIKLNSMLKNAEVGLVAGDDAASTKSVNLSDMVQGFVFADHPTIIMQGLAQAVRQNDFTLNEDLYKQIEIMQKSVKIRKEYLNSNVLHKLNLLYLSMRKYKFEPQDMSDFHKLLQDAQSATLPLKEIESKLSDMDSKIIQMKIRAESYLKYKVDSKIAEIKKTIHENPELKGNEEYIRRLDWLVLSATYKDVPYDAIDIEIQAFNVSLKNKKPEVQRRDTFSRACNLELNVINLAQLIEACECSKKISREKALSAEEILAIDTEIKEYKKIIEECKKVIKDYRDVMYQNGGPLAFQKDGVVDYSVHDKVSDVKVTDRKILVQMQDVTKKSYELLSRKYYDSNEESIPQWFKDMDALVVVDPQRGFIDSHLNELGVAGSQAYIDNINKMIAWAVALKKPIVISGDNHPYDALWAKGEKFSSLPKDDTHQHAGGTCWGNHCCVGTPGALPGRGLIIPPYYDQVMFIAKGTQADSHPASCMHSSAQGNLGLEQLLEKGKMENITVCGWVAEVCVGETVEHLLAAGINVILPHDSTVPLSGPQSMENDSLCKRFTQNSLEKIKLYMLKHSGNELCQKLNNRLNNQLIGQLSIIKDNNVLPVSVDNHHKLVIKP